MQHKTVLLTVKRIQNAAYILLVRLWVLGVKIAPFGREQGAFKNVGGFHPFCGDQELRLMRDEWNSTEE